MPERDDILRMKDIPNVGPATAGDLALLNIREPAQLIGQDPYDLYDDLCRITGKVHDPCVIDVFTSAIRFMEGEPPRKWWYYTPERKQKNQVVRPLKEGDHDHSSNRIK